ncbi:MAG: NADH-quinone oxidoreductase subunit N, partial [Coriobacteriales bacterium]
MTAFVLDVARWAAPVTSILWLPGALALAGAVLGMTADMTGRSRLGLAIVTTGTALAAVLTLGSAFLGMAAPDEAFSVVFGAVVGGGSFSAMAFVVYGVALMALSTGLRSVSDARRVPAAALMAISAVAGQVAMGSGDMLVLFVAIEMLALAGYALVSASANRRADEAAMRYFVQGAVSTGLFAYGVAVLIGAHGGVSFSADLYDAVASDPLLLATLPFVLVLVSMTFKAGAFPFHSWVPDAYETAPASLAGFLASGPKAAVLTALVVVFGRSFWAQEAFSDLHGLIGVLAAGSIIFGNLAALKQRDVGRMLGYSGIAQVGYALVGVTAMAPSTTLFATSYAIAISVAFTCLDAYRRLQPDWDGSIEGLAGAGRRSPGVAFAMTAAMLSLTGIPLTAGFVGKFFVFLNSLDSGLLWLVVLGAAGSVVSFGYYGKVIRAMYLEDTEGDEQSADVGIRAPEPAAGERPRVWP